jgi:ATP-binding cassette subfamily B multidrug efflux pump
MRLVKYAKPYLPLIIIAILLLFVQANTALALPDYMSNIVNVGIQQGGIENAVPVAIRQSEMSKLFIFMNSDSQNVVLTDYLLINSSSPDYSSYLTTYPVLATDPVYVLKSIDSTEINKLNPVLGRGLLIVSSIQQILTDPAKAAALAASLGIDLSTLPPGTDIFTVLAHLSPSQQAILNSVIASKFATLDESMIIQAAAAPIKAEYAALGMDTGKVSTDYIVNIGIQMLLITLLSAICSIAVGFLSARTATGMARDLRTDVFQRVENFSSTEFDKFSTASLITRSTNDITQIQTVVIMVIRMVFYAPIIGVGGVIRAIGKSTSMWWIIALAVIVLLGIILTVFVIALPKFTIVQRLIDRLNLVTRESLSGMMVIRAFNMQGFEENRFDKANTDLTQNSLFINRIMIIMMPFMMLLMNGVTLLIIWVGAHQVAASTMQVGDMLAFMQYAIQIVFAFLMMSVMFILLPRAAVSGNRIGEVLETEPVIQDPKDPKHFNEPFKGVIEYRHVTFRYPGAEEPVLHDITFTAQPGQTTALIGTTGSGKSTIVSLIPRFYDVSEGAVYISGIDIREVTQHELRDRIGYVPQKGMLFSGTIESNLRYGDQNATEDELKIAAEIAQASEIVTEKPEGFQSEIAQGGVNVSGGQKQRLSIARALVKNAPIYIFDDSFSALDFKTDAALRAALNAHTGSSTVLIVTQRIATIMNSEQIIVLDKGRIVGLGTHRELLESCEVYRDIALSQLSQEELL